MTTPEQENKAEALWSLLQQLEAAKDLFVFECPSDKEIAANARLADNVASAIRELLYQCPDPPA